MYIIKLESYEYETGKLPEYMNGMKIACKHDSINSCITSTCRKLQW